MENLSLAKQELKKQKLKHLIISLFLAVLLILLILGFILFTKIPNVFLVIIIIICLVFYSIVLFFLIEEINFREVEIEKIKTIEKFTTIDNPTIERIEVEKPVIQDMPVPVYILEKKKHTPGKRHKYIASNQGKIFHYSTSRLSKLIRPKNKIQNDDPQFFLKKGYKPSARVLKRWKSEEKDLYEKYNKKTKKK
jgi:c-di-AMP phosphodiesterase-like protein